MKSEEMNLLKFRMIFITEKRLMTVKGHRWGRGERLLGC